MGEKIKTLSRGKLFGSALEIELNGPVINNDDRQVHIQSDNYRFEMNKNDYIKYAMSLLVAEKNLKNLKAIK